MSVFMRFHAFDRFAHGRRNVVGIWGDGNLGYITAVFFKTMFPDTKLYIFFGVSKDKLSDFTFADATYQVSDIPENMELDHAFLSVGWSRFRKGNRPDY